MNSEMNATSHFHIPLDLIYGCLKESKSLLNSRIFLFVIKDFQSMISFQDIKFDVGLHFPETHHTKVHRLLLALLQMIAPVHYAFVKYAVPYSKHMRYLMSYHTHRAVLYEVVVDLIGFFIEKPFVIACK